MQAPAEDRPLQRESRPALSAVTSPRSYERLRVLLVTELDDACFRFRCRAAYEQLRDDGVAAKIVSPHHPRVVDEVAAFSVVLFVRQGWSKAVEAIVRRAQRTGARVGFDIDDLLFEKNSFESLPFLGRCTPEEVKYYRHTLAGMRATFEACDFAMGATPEIVRHQSRAGKPAFVHPNLLLREHEFLAPVLRRLKPRLDQGAWIGYMSGSRTHDGDLASCVPALKDVLASRADARLLLCGHFNVLPDFGALADRVVIVPFQDYRVYPWLMARCRVLIAPIEVVTPFTNSKSALKVFEAGAFSTPSVASPTEAYCEAIEQGVTGFTATTRAEWSDAIRTLLDPAVAKAMGTAAYKRALERYSPRNHRSVLARALLDHAGQHDGSPLSPPSTRRPRLKTSIKLATASLRCAAIPWHPDFPGSLVRRGQANR